MHYLEMVHLAEYRDYPIHQISGGMRQRTALARALTMDSGILLMDEPFSALDKQTSNRLREELPANLDGNAKDNPVYHTQRRGGGLSCRPGCGSLS